MRVRARNVNAIMLIALASWSCKGDAAIRPEDDACTINSTTVFVAGGVTFDWSPGCAVAVLRVQDEMGGEMWVVNSPEIASGSPRRSNRIIPRVDYGIPPGGTGSPRLPVPLVAGRNYKLVLWRAYAAGTLPSGCTPNDENICLVAVAPFTRL